VKFRLWLTAVILSQYHEWLLWVGSGRLGMSPSTKIMKGCFGSEADIGEYDAERLLSIISSHSTNFQTIDKQTFTVLINGARFLAVPRSQGTT